MEYFVTKSNYFCIKFFLDYFIFLSNLIQRKFIISTNIVYLHYQN